MLDPNLCEGHAHNSKHERDTPSYDVECAPFAINHVSNWTNSTECHVPWVGQYNKPGQTGY